MTTTQLYLFNAVYLILLVVVAMVTHATARRIAGALAGGFAAGVAALGIMSLGERAEWWNLEITWRPYFLVLVVVNFALCAFVLLLTWRIARRFGSRGLIVVMIFVAIIGPLRDYWYMTHFPEWGAYRWGIGTVLAVSATYVLLLTLGHGVMRLVAGPARADRLARLPWEAAKPTAGADH